MSDYPTTNANTHWAYPTSQETDLAIARSRIALADFLVAQPAEIASAQHDPTFHLARALGSKWGPRDEIVITELIITRTRPPGHGSPPNVEWL